MTTVTESPQATMRANPVDLESPFRVDELFFSVTDPTSRIITGNSVFLRVAKYDVDEMVGQPHNMVRHPDMPRAAFRIVWDFLTANKPVAAYVKNMAKDGSYYWVFAYMFPVGNKYLSVRLKPTSELFPAVVDLYAHARAAEIQVETQHGREASIEAGLAEFESRLAQLGFDSYGDFMRQAMITEMFSRDKTLGTVDRTDTKHEHHEIWGGLQGAYARLCALLGQYMGRVSYFQECDALLSSKSEFLKGLSENIRIVSLNAILACDLIPGSAETLSAVASLMRDRSNAISGLIESLTDALERFSVATQEIGFCIASSQLEADLVAQYIANAVVNPQAEHQLATNLELLSQSVRESNAPIRRWLAELITESHTIFRLANQVKRELSVLRVLHMNGRVEAAAVSRNESISELFHGIGGQVQHAQTEMEHFSIVETFFQLEQLSRGGLHSKATEAIDVETKRTVRQLVHG